MQETGSFDGGFDGGVLPIDAAVGVDSGRDSAVVVDAAAQADTGAANQCPLPDYTDLPEEPASTRTFTDLARVAPTARACADDDFSSTEGCYNLRLPPPPSIRRSTIRPTFVNPEPGSAVDGQRSKPFTFQPSQPGQTFIIPEHRTTTDGRLASWAPLGNQPAIAVISPENADYGLQTTENQIVDRIGYFHSAIQVDPRDGRSRFPAGEMQRGDFSGRGRFWDLCTGTGPEQTQNPAECRARRNASGSYINGDCYRVTPLFALVSPENRWELRSNELIVFVPRGKAIAGPARTSGDELWIFPASVWPTSGNTLPDYELYDYGRNVAYVGPGMWDYNWTWARYYEQARVQCTRGDAPAWCRFLSDQKHISVQSNYRMWRSPTDAYSWTGHGNGHALLEPATTADGRVLIIHDDTKGIMYSYNALGPCRADGFVEFRSITQAYSDPNVHGRYGFAEYQLRDTRGTLIPPGTTIHGGYPWIDRRGANIMFPHGGGQDGWRARWEQGGAEATSAQINRANGRAVVVVGSWTRGKITVVDNGLNATDFTFSQGWVGDPYYDGVFTLPIYSNGLSRLRPAGISLLSSLEASLNHYDAWTPITPADVVWIASSTTERNAEIVFDDYLDTRAMVVAHMNTPIRLVRANYDYLSGGTNIGEGMTDSNGFGSRDDNNYNYQFGRSAVELQNASTASGSQPLILAGGAFVPPIFEGGVRGKGVFLDGANDRIIVRGLTSVDNYYLSLWIDVRENGWATAEPQTLFTFPNGARVHVARNGVGVAASGGSGVATPAVIARGRYTHIGVEVVRRGGQSSVTFFVDGNLMGTVVAPFDMPLTQRGGTFTVGNNGMATNALRAWVDELRVYRLRTEDVGSMTSRELYCNQALGTLRASTCGANGASCEQLDFRHNEAVDSNGIGVGLDYPLEAYAPGACANSVHRNHGDDCLRENALGIAERHLAASLERPNFTDRAFCTTCHSDGDPVVGLSLDALQPGTMASRLDPRRQPLTWPRSLFGTRPNLNGTVGAPYNAMTSSFLDDIILGGDARTPARRILPRTR